MHLTVVEIWARMGLFARLIVLLLGATSVVSVIVIVERALLFARSSAESRAFAARMGPQIVAGKLREAAAAKLGDDIGHLGRVVRAGLQAYATTCQIETRPGSDLVFESVARALERQTQRETQALRRGVPTLATVASTAPFVGLLGTVIGIINSFNSLAASGSGGLGTVSAGIAEALGTTAVGLFVAILAVVAYNILSGWTDARAVDITEASNELLDVVARELATSDRTAR